MIIDDLNQFLEQFIKHINETGLDVTAFNMDHAAYQASSVDDYEKRKEELLSIASLANEALIGGRRVAVLKLHEPILFEGNTITALEVIEPKEGQEPPSAWEHAEYVIDEPFETFMEKYPLLRWNTGSLNRSEYQHLKLQLAPHIQVKFHLHTILETIIFEQSK